MGRPLIEQIDLEPCYHVADGGSCWVVRCRHCSAGWLPRKADAEGIAPLLRHAKRKHKIRLARKTSAMDLSSAPRAAYIPGMPMRIPADAHVVTDSRITLIRVISTLHDRLVEGTDGLKAKVKATLTAKGAQFAESDLVVAALRAGAAKRRIDPKALYALVKAKKLTIEQFLSCITVSREPLEQYLSGDQIEQISIPGKTPEPSLFTEFREGVQLDIDELAESLAGAVARVVPIKAA